MVPIVFEDAEIIVVEKPSGLLVHPSVQNEPDTLLAQLTVHAPEIATAGGEEHRPGIVHRLDKFASGLMVVAKTPHAFSTLKEQFQNHTIQKRYVVLVYGSLPREEGTLNFSIERSKRSGRMAAKPAGSGGKESITEYLVTGRSPYYTLLLVKTGSGRTHQIRTHFFAFGHPVVGDTLYRSDHWTNDAPRLFLHACLLGFEHPTTGKHIEFKSELPEELKQYLEKKHLQAHS